MSLGNTHMKDKWDPRNQGRSRKCVITENALVAWIQERQQLDCSNGLDTLVHQPMRVMCRLQYNFVMYV